MKSKTHTRLVRRLRCANTDLTVLKTIRAMVRQAQEDNCDVIDGMPDVATNAAQRALQDKHGTPKAFAAACVNAIGDISPLEAHTAIKRYRDLWAMAANEKADR